MRKRIWIPAVVAAVLVILVATPLLMKEIPSQPDASVVVYVESQTNNVMIYESGTDQENMAVIWLFEGPEEESSTS